MTDKTNASAETQVEETAAPASPDASAALDAWTMGTAILTGLQKAYLKTVEELDAAERAQKGDMRFGHARTLIDLRDALSAAERDLDFELHRIAKSSGFPMPARVT